MAKSHSIAQAKYDSTHCKYYTLKMNLVNDADIIDKLDKVDSKQGYIKDLIRQDLARTGSDKGSVSVSFSPAAMSILEENAKEKGLSVSDLVSVIVNEQLIRICSDSAPKTETE